MMNDSISLKEAIEKGSKFLSEIYSLLVRIQLFNYNQ